MMTSANNKLEDIKANAADLTTLYEKTTVALDATAVTNITGTIAGLKAVYEAGASEITGIESTSITTIDTVEVSVIDLNFLNLSTFGVIDASSIKELASVAIIDLNTMFTAGNDTSQFTDTSFSQLSKIPLNDDILNVVDLNGAIDQVNQFTEGTSTIFELSSGATINSGTESEFEILLDFETAGQVGRGGPSAPADLDPPPATQNCGFAHLRFALFEPLVLCRRLAEAGPPPLLRHQITVFCRKHGSRQKKVGFLINIPPDVCL